MTPVEEYKTKLEDYDEDDCLSSPRVEMERPEKKIKPRRPSQAAIRCLSNRSNLLLLRRRRGQRPEMSAGTNLPRVPHSMESSTSLTVLILRTRQESKSSYVKLYENTSYKIRK